MFRALASLAERQLTQLPSICIQDLNHPRCDGCSRRTSNRVPAALQFIGRNP
jgi:hypothetical protein